MALLRPDKVYLTGSFCKKKAFYIPRTVQKQRTGREMGKNPPKKMFFFSATPANWLSLAVLVAARPYSCCATSTAKLSQLDGGAGNSPFLEGFRFFTDYLYMKRIF